MSNIDTAIAVVVFIIIWVVIAIVASIAIRAGQKLWKKFKDEFEPDD